METNKSASSKEVLILLIKMVAILLMLFGSIFVFQAIALDLKSVKDVTGLGIGVEMQLIGLGLLLIAHKATSKPHQTHEDNPS